VCFSLFLGELTNECEKAKNSWWWDGQKRRSAAGGQQAHLMYITFAEFHVMREKW
jgi:hypothetical protein